MLIDGQDLIARQLEVTKPTEVTFPDGQKTILNPARTVPQVDGDENVLSLDGEWRVTKWPFQTKESKLVSSAVKDSSWSVVAQPGKVFYSDPDGEGKEIPNWDRVSLSHIDDEDGAVLRRRVAIPVSWKKKRIYLRFDAIYPAGRVYLNGVLLGEHLSGLTPVEFDVTDKVTPGETVLVAVRLLRKHPFVRMDMPRHALEFAGLAQSVCFHTTGLFQISDYRLISTLDAKGKKGTVEGKVCITNSEKKQATCSLTVTLKDAAGQRIASQRKTIKILSGAHKEIPIQLEVLNPCLWNDEFPNLYTVVLSLSFAKQPDQTITYRTGFRRLDLSPSGPRLNGQPVKFRGVNHLTFHPEHGMYTPREWLRQDLALMKKANVNAIRTHFLGARCLAELCDEMGFYLLQELPIDWGTNYIHDPEWVGPALMRMEGGIRRDRHHPSVMVWSVGNENMPQTAQVAEQGWNHLRIYDQFAKVLDPSRPTMFPPPGPANKIEGIFEFRVGDIADTHYSFVLAHKFMESKRCVNPRSWEADMEEMTHEQARKQGWSGVWFSSEYGIMNMMPDLLNAPYNSLIDDVPEDILSFRNSLQVFQDRLLREWGFMRKEKSCLGGAYFPWLCCGAGKGPEGNPWGWVRWGEDADWGVVTADLLPKPFFWALRTLFSPVWFPKQLIWKKGQTKLQFEIENQYNSIDLKDCTLRTMMGGGGTWMTFMRKFKDIPISCKPGEKKKITIPLWNKDTLSSLQNNSPVICRCILLDPRGFRPLTADIVVIPEASLKVKESPMPVGPDAVLE